MNALQNNLPLSQGLFGSTELDDARSATIKKTYLLLSLSVVSAIAGGYAGIQVPALISFFGSTVGWIVAMVALNAIPFVAMACRHNPVLGTLDRHGLCGSDCFCDDHKGTILRASGSNGWILFCHSRCAGIEPVFGHWVFKPCYLRCYWNFRRIRTRERH